jgi:hypothetical protein
LDSLQQLPMEHQTLAKRLEDYEGELAPQIAEREAQRQAIRIAAATDQLRSYEAEIAPREAELEKQQQQRIAQADAALKAYEQELPQRQANGNSRSSSQPSGRCWIPIELKASNNAKLDRQDDLSVFVSGPNGKGQYTFAARTDLEGITGIKLEALTDDRLPNKGPGRAQNGNFVLSEFKVQWAPEGEPDKKTAVALQNAQADYSQDNYNVSTAIDGQVAPTNNGWATSPRVGENRTAVFETKENTGAGPGRLTVTWISSSKTASTRSAASASPSPRPRALSTWTACRKTSSTSWPSPATSAARNSRPKRPSSTAAWTAN